MPRPVCALGAVPSLRAAFRQSATETGVEGLAAVAASTTTQTTLGGLAFNGLDGIAPTGRGLPMDAQKGFAFVVDTTRAKEFALAHRLVNGADGGRLFVRCFGGGGNVRENAVGGVLASLTTMAWNTPSKSWTGGATMADASLNLRMTVRLRDAVAFVQIGAVGSTGRSSWNRFASTACPEARRRSSPARQRYPSGSGISLPRRRWTCPRSALAPRTSSKWC